MAVEKLHTAITAPLWTIGPSLPTAKPPSTDSVTPTALQASVLMRTSRGTFVGLVRAAGTAGRVCERRLLAGGLERRNRCEAEIGRAHV